jgi:hypothetical protein
MSLEEAEQKLAIKEEDLKAIRRANDPNWVLRGLIVLAVSIVTFVIGFIAGNANPSVGSNYPYAGAMMSSQAAGGMRRVPVLFIAILAALSFISFSFGLAVGNRENLGVVILYGPYSQKG